MTYEEALLIEKEFLNDFIGNHMEFSKFKGKANFWYLNLAKKHKLKSVNKTTLKIDDNYNEINEKFDKKKYQQEYNKKNKEKIAQQSKKWYQDNIFNVKLYKRMHGIKVRFKKRMLDENTEQKDK